MTEEIYENHEEEVERVSFIEPARTLIDLPKIEESMHVVKITEARKKNLRKKLSRSNSIGNISGLLRVLDDIQIENDQTKSLSVEDIHYESLDLPKRRRKSGMTLWRWSKTEKKSTETKSKTSTQLRKKSKFTDIGSKVGRRISLTIGDLFLSKRLRFINYF